MKCVLLHQNVYWNVIILPTSHGFNKDVHAYQVVVPVILHIIELQNNFTQKGYFHHRDIANWHHNVTAVRVYALKYVVAWVL